MTKKLILELEADESLWKGAQQLAAQRQQPLERWIVDQVEQVVPKETETLTYEQARRHALELLKKGLPLGGVPLTREEAHQRRP